MLTADGTLAPCIYLHPSSIKRQTNKTTKSRTPLAWELLMQILLRVKVCS